MVWPTFTDSFDAPVHEPAPPAAPPTAEEVLNHARLEAAQILQNAAAEADAAVAGARSQGLEQGFAEGFEAGRAELEQQRQQLALVEQQARLYADSLRQAAEAEAKAIRAQAEARAQELLGQAREEAGALLTEARTEQHRRLEMAQTAVVELAVAAATRLVQGHLAIQPASVVAMVANGLQRLKDTNCSVRISPEDLPLLEAQRYQLEKELGAGLLQLQPDAGITRGGYIVSSPQGGIDGRVEQQAHLLRAALAAALGGSES